jgi:hypothetical protein
LENRTEPDFTGSEGDGREGEESGEQGGEMAQTIYTHMNK